MMTLLTTDGARLKAIEMVGEYVFLGDRQKAGSILVLSGPRRRVIPDLRHVTRHGYTVLSCDGTRRSAGNE